MKENKSPWTVFQIGLGIILILGGLSGFILSQKYLLASENLLMGAGLLLFGLSDNNKDESKKGKRLFNLGSILLIFGVGLILFDAFFY